ncbi:MAG: dihydroorotase family protein, partial [Nitrososphaerota archaeon]|jgi:dihydroorotase (multifunctional complex type)|nr:dihydroorotase family protein [Nitrososphaerota archaeon]
VEAGKFVKIGKHPQMPNADQKNDLHGMLVLPGLIDGHVHLRDEGKTYKEDFISGTSAAAAGGFTTVLDMPNNLPLTNSVEAVKNRLEIAKKRTLVNVGLYSEFPENLTEISQIGRAGIIGFKLFMGNQIGGLNIDDDQALEEGFRAAGEAGLVVAVHAEDKNQIIFNEQQFKKAKRNGVKEFLLAHTEQAEVQAMKRALKSSENSKVHLHFCHVTSKQGIETIKELKNTGKKVTCEVTPNHLMLTSADATRCGMMAIMAPPLRDKLHQEALLEGVSQGVVDAIGSDHAPHTFEEKSVDSVWEVKVGTPGLETTLPLMLSLVKKDLLSFQRFVEVFAERPAEIYGLTNKGKLESGKDADLTVIDYNQRWTIAASKFKSKAKFSLYNNWKVIGKPIKTFVNGILVMDESEIVAKPGSGRIVQKRLTQESAFGAN